MEVIRSKHLLSQVVPDHIQAVFDYAVLYKILVKVHSRKSFPHKSSKVRTTVLLAL